MMIENKNKERYDLLFNGIIRQCTAWVKSGLYIEELTLYISRDDVYILKMYGTSTISLSEDLITFYGMEIIPVEMKDYLIVAATKPKTK